MNPTKKPGRPKGTSTCDLQCVAFLTRESLQAHIQILQFAGEIGHAWFVYHEPDKDGNGKVHAHLRMSPPLSRAVNWTDICAKIQETVPGESLPRKLVLSKQAVNDKYLDGLLYARHDKRYLTLKQELNKPFYDYPKEAFWTDDQDWFDTIWAESDTYEPESKKLSKVDILKRIEEENGRIDDIDLLRLTIVNGFTQGDYLLFTKYQHAWQKIHPLQERTR